MDKTDVRFYSVHLYKSIGLWYMKEWMKLEIRSYGGEKMRTSSQLTKIHQCRMHPHANITQTTDSTIRAAAQKEIVMRILQGEEITDIRGEIDNILFSKDCMWENREQKNANLALYNSRIRRFVNWERQREHIFPSDLEADMTIDFFGEEVLAKPDYFVPDGNKMRIVKVKTSRFKSEKDDLETNETYALGLVGEKLFPDREIVVEIIHLGDKDSRTEMQAINRDFDAFQKTSYLHFNDEAKAFFTQKHEEEMSEHNECSPEECAGCSAYNLCHFEEPPISVDIMKEVKPISEIRLTHAQQQVIDYEEGVARVNAGPGAGKTLVVAMRIVELLKKGYDPEKICLLTFTNAGAAEMTARVVQYCAGYGLLIDPDRLTSTTFNAFCQNLITAYFDELDYTCPPRVIPDETRSGIINRILDQFPHIPEWNYATVSNDKSSRFGKTALNSAKQIFAEIKKEGHTRETNPYRNYDTVSLDLIFQMYDEYDRQLHQRNLLEYDDQILQVFKLLEVHPTLFDEIGFEHIIVDEFQDTDLPQINLLNNILDTPSFKSFMAVGDDSQSIFAFRHTSPEYMINFDTYFGRFDDFSLVENHRSTGDIIDFANKINALNENRVEKDLIATKPNGSGPSIHGFYSQDSEYKWVAEEIKRKIESGQTPSDIAFLASDRNELMKMAGILTEMGIPSILMNPIPFSANSRVAALCTFYDSFESGSTRGYLDYQNVLAHGGLRGATAVELESISEEFGNEIRSGARTVTRFMEYAKALDIEEVDECYQSFLEKVGFCQTTEELSEFFRDFKLYGADSMFKREGKYEGVCLTTVHSAKGLEWDTTYLTLSHFDKDTYHKFASRFAYSGEKDEVNRKWFVGATRAREELIMTGQYVLKMNKNELVLNDYVKKAYELMNKVYGYNSAAYWETKSQEDVERQNRAIRALELHAMSHKPTKVDIQGRSADYTQGNIQKETQRIMGMYGENKANRNAAVVGSQRRPQAFIKSSETSLETASRPAKVVEDLSADEIEFV